MFVKISSCQTDADTLDEERGTLDDNIGATHWDTLLHVLPYHNDPS